MSVRILVLKKNDSVFDCPKCGGNENFTIHSEQVCEDGCEVWAVCKCGYDPTAWDEAGSGHRIESVMGGLSNEDCLDALTFSWNPAVLEVAAKPKTPQP